MFGFFKIAVLLTAKSWRETSALCTITEELRGWKWHKELGAFMQAGTILKAWRRIFVLLRENPFPYTVPYTLILN